MADKRVVERPIVCKSSMVSAILSGRKTQTRRIIDRLVDFPGISMFALSDTPGYDYCFRNKFRLWNEMKAEQVLERCPYGKPGDRLWVRETIKRAGAGACWYAADNQIVMGTDALTGERMPALYSYSRNCLPSIHMPRDWCRIVLEITDVRIERLQTISRVDAIAEGIEQKTTGWKDYSGMAQSWNNPVTSFQSLWTSLYSDSSWQANPWVWAISFKRMEL